MSLLSLQGSTLYMAAIVKDLYVTVGCTVFVQGQEGEDDYVARVVRLLERNKDGAKMITCQWFYRAKETVLAEKKGKKQLNEVLCFRPLPFSFSFSSFPTLM